MNNSNKLEMYLIKLEKSLGSIPISEKAEIITEIKSHILDATESDSEAKIDDILKSLGEPEQVANKYLLERGLSPQKPPKHPIVKWLVIGFLGTFAMCAIFTMVLLFKFSPLVQVDEEKGTVKILGGMIDVKEEGKSVTIKDFKFGNISVNGTITDSFDLTNKNIAQLSVDLTNVKLMFDSIEKNMIGYDCDTVEGSKPKLEQAGKVLKFTMTNSKNAKCSISVPKNLDIDIAALNGNFSFNKLANNLKLEAKNGKIEFVPDPKLKYNYKLKVTNGKIGDFIGSADKDAYKVELNLINGKIDN